jgi:hypothetical protein
VDGRLSRRVDLPERRLPVDCPPPGRPRRPTRLGPAPGRHRAGIPGAAVSETPAADYRYRATLPRQTVADALAAAVKAIAHPNVKASVAVPDRHDAYLECWGILRAGKISRRS